jgi:hypothetical protein
MAMIRPVTSAVLALILAFPLTRCWGDPTYAAGVPNFAATTTYGAGVPNFAPTTTYGAETAVNTSASPRFNSYYFSPLDYAISGGTATQPVAKAGGSIPASNVSPLPVTNFLRV